MTEPTLVSQFEKIAVAFPTHTAVTIQGKVLSYQDLNRQANQLAHRLLDYLGPVPQPVAFVLGYSLQTIISILGILKASQFYVPIDPILPPARIRQILEDTQAPLVITNQLNLEKTAAACQGLESTRILNLDEHLLDGPSHNPGLPITPEHIAYLLYTSGSTGKPKGVIHAHRDTLHNTEIQSADLQVGQDDRFGLYISLGFEAARFCLFSALLNGGTLCLYDIRAEGVSGLANWIEQEHISVFLATPSALRHMFQNTPPGLVLSSVRLVNLGGEPVTIHELELFRKHFPASCRLVNTLGSSETGVITRFVATHETQVAGRTLPAGYPPGERQILVVDEQGVPLPTGQVGEIWLKSRYLSPGYWRLPEATAVKFTTDPVDSSVRIYHTGDLGRLAADGCLEYRGRKDSQVKIRGYRIEVAEIEAVLLHHPQIRDAAIAVQPSQRTADGKRLVAFLAAQGVQPQANEIRRFIQERLPEYMTPDAFVFLEALPRTASGKVDLQKLKFPDESEPAEARDTTAPRDELETRLVRIWERVLKVEPIGIHENYFELGGNSLLAAQLFAQIEKAFGRKFPLASLFQAATVAAQADLLRQENYQPNWSALVALRSGGNRPPLFFAAPVGGNVLSYYDLIQRLDPEIPCYGLQAVGLDGVQKPKQNMQELVAHYIQEMRSVQATGPYYLAGSSFGGLVAYEMAQQLHDQGEPVALVVMFDSYGPGYPHRLPSTSRIKRRFFKIFNRLESHLTNLAIADWRGRFEYARAKSARLSSRISRFLRNKIDQLFHPLPQELRRVRFAQSTVAKKRRRHQRELRRFGGRLILYRATKQPRGIYPDPLLGWGKVVGSEIEVYEIPGHHTSIIYEPRVSLLASSLNEILSATLQHSEPAHDSGGK